MRDPDPFMKNVAWWSFNMFDLWDVLFLTGLAVLGYGLYLISTELMLITIGTIVTGLGTFGAIRKIQDKK